MAQLAARRAGGPEVAGSSPAAPTTRRIHRSDGRIGIVAQAFRYLRIVTSARLADRYLTIQVKEAPEPGGVTGQLFALVEIEQPWSSSAQIGQTLINTLARHYFRGTSQQPLTNFEEALKKTNDTLKQLAVTGENEWSEHLNACLILVVDNAIHIANSGTIHAWLIRNHKPSRIFEPTKPANGKIFSSVLSGQFEPADRLMIASSGILKLAPVSELASKVYSVGPLDQFAQQLLQLIRTRRGQWVNALIFDAIDPSAPSQSDTLPDTLFTDTSSTDAWKLSVGAGFSSAGDQLAKTSQWFKSAHSEANTYLQSTILPRGKDQVRFGIEWGQKMAASSQPFLDKARQQLQGWIDQARQRLTQREQATETEVVADTTVSPTPDSPKDGGLIGQTVYTINDYTLTEQVSADTNQAASPVGSAPRVNEYRPAGFSAQALLSKLAPERMNLRTWIQSRWQTIGFGLLVVILLVMLVANVRSIVQNRSQAALTATQTAELDLLEKTYEDAKLAEIFNQPDKALDGLVQVITQVQPYVDSAVSERAKKLLSDAQTELDTLTKTTRITSSTTLAQVNGATAFAQWDSTFVVTTPDDIQRVATGEQASAQTLTTIPTQELPATVAPYDDTVGAVIFTESAGYELTNEAQSATALGLPETAWKTGSALASFVHNQYLLAPSENQIWKFTRTNDAITAITPYLVESADLSKAVDLAIDGRIYVLTNEGKVLCFNRGRAESFELKGIPKPNEQITSPRQIRAAGDSLFILDDTRIIQVNTAGQFERQFAFSDLSSIEAFSVDSERKQFFLLSQGALRQAEYTE